MYPMKVIPDMLTNRTAHLGMYSVLKSRVFADWSVEKMNLDKIPNRI